jgi:hypothetical protein
VIGCKQVDGKCWSNRERAQKQLKEIGKLVTSNENKNNEKCSSIQCGRPNKRERERERERERARERERGEDLDLLGSRTRRSVVGSVALVRI